MDAQFVGSSVGSLVVLYGIYWLLCTRRCAAERRYRRPRRLQPRRRIARTINTDNVVKIANDIAEELEDDEFEDDEFENDADVLENEFRRAQVNEYNCPYILPRPMFENWIVRRAGRGIIGHGVSLACRVFSCAYYILLVTMVTALMGAIVHLSNKNDVVAAAEL